MIALLIHGLLVGGYIFGFTDNAILIGCAMAGADIDKWIGGRIRIDPALGAIVGAALGNTISDGIGAWIAPSMTEQMLGIVIGCLVPMIAIPFYAMYRKRKASPRLAQYAEWLDIRNINK